MMWPDKPEWYILYGAAVIGLMARINWTECQIISGGSPYGVYPPTSFSTTGGGGALLPFPLFPTPCEVGYITCEGPAGYIITNINIPGPPAIPATTPRPAPPPQTTPRPTSPVTTPRPTPPAVTTPRPTVPAPTTPRTTPRPAQPQSIQQQIIYMYPPRCNMWCRLIYKPQPVYHQPPCILFNWLGMGGAGGMFGGGYATGYGAGYG
uniref:Uncharacterized protein n=1 Tax=Cacopsylla melanoneura TaxID=428564 RepID=A0A8D8ZYL7_9HEMI